MKKALLAIGLSFILFNINAEAQNKTGKTKQAAAKSTVKTKTISQPETVKPPPPPPPTFAEIKQANVMATCKQVITWSAFGYNFIQNDGSPLVMRLEDISYYPSQEKDKAQVRLKDDKQHTMFRFDVVYDSASGKVQEIVVFSAKELNETQYNSEHKKYKPAYFSKFRFNYPADTLMQLLQYYPPYTEPQYSWELKMTADSFAITQYQYDNRRIFIKSWLDRKTMRIDSSYFTTYSSFSPYTPLLYGRNYHHYANGLTDDILMFGETKWHTRQYHKVFNADGKTLQDQATTIRTVGYSNKEHLWTLLKRNEAGLVIEKAFYSFSSGATAEMPLSVPEGQIPTTETYFYNAQNIVNRKTSFYEDKCITRKVTTDYVFDEEGFVLEYANKTDLQTRCRY